jgi:hypothetical protein
VTARRAKPGDPYAISDSETRGARSERIHRAYHLMPWDQGAPELRELSLGNMQVGAAGSARPHPHAHFSRSGLGQGPIG